MTAQDQRAWPAGDSEMAALVRAHDWPATPLGPVDQWPQSLKTAILLVLTGGFPMILRWGHSLVQIYNDRYRQLMGDKHPAGLGQPTRECWPEVWHINQPVYERVSAGETVTLEEAHFPLQRQAGDGRVDDLYLTLAYSPVFDDAGLVGGVLVTAHDVTAQVAGRRAEAERDRLAAALQAERIALLEEVFRTAPSFLHVLRGPQFVFELANEAYYRLVGHRDLLGQPAFEAMPEAASGGYQARIARVMATREPFHGRELPVTLARTPGSAPEERIIDLVYLPIIDPDGSCTRVLGHGTDVTERVREREKATAARLESEERFGLAAESSSLGTYEIDPRADTITLSAAVARLYGLEADRAVPLAAVFDRIHPEDREPMAALLARVLTPDGQDEYAYQHRVVGPDGTLCWLDARARVRFEPDQAGALHPVRVIGVAWDVTEHRRLVESLQHADRAKDEFLATLAHELRNPLAPLRNVASLLKRSGPTPAQQPLIEIMERQVGQLRRLVDDLLEVSRITQGKIVLKREPMRVSAAVYAALEAIQPMIEQRGQVFETRVSSSALVDIDAARITQVVTNLLNNASKFTPEGGRIVLEAFDEADAVIVRVRDEGIGIAPEVLPRVFELFAQGSSTTTDQAQAGLGIGLSLVKRLVEMHGGTVQARSEGLGQGACFAVRLPRSDPPSVER